MGDILMPNKFGAFYKYLQDDEVTDVDYNGKDVWVKDVYNRRYKADEPDCFAPDDNGELSFHAHASFSYIEDEEVKLFGGHLREAYICYTGEIIVSPAELNLQRSRETGMNIWKFS